MSKYHKSEGGLWPNKDKKAQNHPDMTGKVDLTREQLKGLIAMAKKGETPKVKLASWTRKAQDTGQPYQYVTGEVFWDGEETASAPPPPPPVPEPQPILIEEDDIPF
jgi:hypothetical protein